MGCWSTATAAFAIFVEPLAIFGSIGCCLAMLIGAWHPTLRYFMMSAANLSIIVPLFIAWRDRSLSRPALPNRPRSTTTSPAEA
jgi:hypothetical protein